VFRAPGSSHPASGSGLRAAGSRIRAPCSGFLTTLPLNFQFLLHPRYTLFVQQQTRTSLGPRAPPLASSFDLFSRRPHQQPQIPTCGLDCTLSKRSAWHYNHPTRSSLYILSRAERRALPTPRGKGHTNGLWQHARWRGHGLGWLCVAHGAFAHSWTLLTVPGQSTQHHSNQGEATQRLAPCAERKATARSAWR
jgi:hypothetical protein